MSDSLDRSVGQILRETRDAQHISLDDVALRLRLMHRQIEAMESDDFQSLGQPVFARGFVRNYARLLGIQPESLLDRMEGAPAEPAPITQAEPPMPSSWLSSPWLILFMLGVVVVVAVPVSLYLWLNSDAGEPQAPGSLGQMPQAVQSAVVPSLAANTPVESPIVATVPPEALAAPVEAAAPAAAPSESIVHLEFGDESWVEVKDASGQMLLRQLHAAGSSADIRGRPPFVVVIGNAAQARMTYNGRPIDLKPYIDVSVARFTLEE